MFGPIGGAADGIGHYAELVRQLPATSLARALARRAQGMARRAAWKRREGTGLPRVLASHGVTSPDDLIGAALDQRAPGGFCEVAQRAGVLAALDRCDGARQRTLLRAEAAAEGRYDVFGASVTFGEGLPIDWALDPISGHRYPSNDAATLTLSPPGVDPKAPWVIGRLDDLVALAQGTWAEEDPTEQARFVRAAVARLEDFLRANPLGVGIQWTCPMEVALRAANIAVTLVMLADRSEVREPAFLGQALTALADHVDWVEAHLEDGGAVPNNHLLANFTGLYLVHLLFPKLPNAAAALSRARAGLESQALAQVHAEGTSFEGSVPYHRLSLEMLTLCEVAGRSYGLPFGDLFRARLHGMYRVVRALIAPGGRAPQIGDNDSGRVFPWAERRSLDFSYLAPLGAALFGDAALKSRDEAYPDEAVWLLGSEGVSRYESLEPLSAPCTTSFPEAGWHVLSGADAHVVVSAGRLGQRGVGGHSHNDALSFELHLGGAPLIVDPGSVTYTREPSLRNALRATAAHNTLQVDDQEINPIDPKRLFSLPDRSRARVEILQKGAQLDRLVVSHEGYRRLERGGTVERTFLLDKRERVLSVVDAFSGAGPHTLTSRLHVSDREACLVDLPAAVASRLRSVPEAPRLLASLAVRLRSEGRESFVVFEAGVVPQLEDACVSEGYGLLRPSRVVVWRTSTTGAVRQRWAIALG